MDNYTPAPIKNDSFRFDAFQNGSVLYNKKKNHLPAMGWNSWNAFGSENTEALTRTMADKIIELGLDKLGYKYVVLDDGCYKPEREGGFLSNEPVKFPSGFRALADYIHAKGLKFGMYNDIGTNLCAGAAVGTYGHETDDARTYLDWGVDFIKVDNCYYMFDNATFSNPENARFVYAPNIKSVRISVAGKEFTFRAEEGRLTGCGARFAESEDGTFKYATDIGTFDGTGPDNSPVGDMSGELVFTFDPGDLVKEKTDALLVVEYAAGREPGTGSWLQVAASEGEKSVLFFDEELPETPDKESFVFSSPIKISLFPGENTIRLMNHRRQENTLISYAELLRGFNEADSSHDVILSICEWGKTQPQNWGYKVGDSWRILNDITFQVGSDGNPGHGAWESDYTTGVCAQYNKAVIMDEYSGLDKGWNDPDMLMIGMDGLDMTMCETHFTMWCMMNSPLMLGLDLRRVQKGDEIYRIISNEDIIALSQDPLGVQAKRVWTSTGSAEPDKEYIRDNNRLDILAKPLADGSLAVSFINLSGQIRTEKAEIPFDRIVSMIGGKMKDPDAFIGAGSYAVKDLLSGNKWNQTEKKLSAPEIREHGSFTCRITPCL